MAATENTPTPQPVEARLVPAASVRRRARLEQTIYGTATLGITIASQQPTWWPAHLTALAVGGASAWRLLDRLDDATGWGLLRACQKAVPALSATAVYLTNLLAPGAPWWEWALPSAWGTVMALTTPVTHAANLIPAALPTRPEPAALDSSPAATTVPAQGTGAPTTYGEYRAWEWANAKATGDTLLTSVTLYQEGVRDFWGIVIAPQGQAVPDLNDTTLAGVFDLPPGTVKLQLIDGSGPGRKLLAARPTLDQLEQHTADPVQRLFTEKLACPGGGATGMHFVGAKTEPNRVAIRVTAPDNELIQLNQKQITRAIGYKDPALVMVETDGLGDGLISIYQRHPLMDVREATADDLRMREDGSIQIGIRPDGRAARMQLYDPQLGALTDLFVGAMGAGKSVTLNTILAAERISGVVSIVADAQNGMSLPEADGRTYHFGKGEAAVAATLAAAYEVAQYREKVSAANGWAGFELGDPWPLANLTLDELNRILSADAVVPRPFKQWVVGLVANFQSTGRKFGMGIRFAAQAIHLADLGDKDKIRANAKNGTVWLGRTNSSTTQHMATDGVIPLGVTLEPIAPNFQLSSDIDAAFTGTEAAKGPRTAGMANMIQGGSVFLSRTFNARKENKTYPGLIGLYESAPIPTLTPAEHDIFTRAYAKWLPHAEQLLAGDDPQDTTTGTEYAPGAPVGDEDDQPSVGSIKDRILDLLADGQPWALKDVRGRLSDVTPGSVNNAMSELREAGHVQPAGNRGTYQITR
ncbi:hypothetical protein [Streptomyces cylindrosporus]|uniref:Uncharacterized protein n=1 Tax=Streptomyces cylindrosporus TaxID=2927583 RepID=A0ABS9YPB2_9ACTN|nr:hypothetical protein [Streptomyces cylindrosporus]MCI3279108.1 hypothetical protein [Streptomyces cylindrosporus]